MSTWVDRSILAAEADIAKLARVKVALATRRAEPPSPPRHPIEGLELGLAPLGEHIRRWPPARWLDRRLDRWWIG
jgi:hypothetical protein